MARLIFEKKSKDSMEYLVKNKRGDMFGDVAYYKIKGHKKKDWWFFFDWNPMDGNRDYWFGEDCHREIADFLAELKKNYPFGKGDEE